MLETKRELERAIREGQPAPEEAPKTLPLEAIREYHEVFQPRGPAGYASKAHIKDLAKVPKAGHTLDPVTVFWIGKGWAVIDGHHRLAAYRAAVWRKPVPVAVFRGPLDNAMGYAGKANSGEKLPMSSSEKKALAWKLTTCTDLSKEKVRLASGMSDGFMSNMRRIYRTLIEGMRMDAGEVAQLTWFEAQKKVSGDEAGNEEIDFEARDEKEAQEWADKLLRTIGKRGQQKPEVLARALEIYDIRLPVSLREYWDTERGPVEVLEEFENDDF